MSVRLREFTFVVQRHCGRGGCAGDRSPSSPRTITFEAQACGWTVVAVEGQHIKGLILSD